MPLQFTDLLDPRTLVSGEEAFAGCVNIPLAELGQRVHELPRAGEPVRVVGDPEIVAATSEVLEKLDRIPLTGSEGEGAGPFRLWRPNAWLEQAVAGLAPGRALDLACGVGRDAVFLADLGWAVTAVDHLPDALAIGEDLRSRYARDGSVNWICADVGAFVPFGGTEGTESTESHGEALFDLAAMFFFLNREVVRRTVRWLRPAGLLVMETFTVEQHRAVGRPRLAWCLEAGELRELCEGLEILSYEEGVHDKGHTARVFARKR